MTAHDWTRYIIGFDLGMVSTAAAYAAGRWSQRRANRKAGEK